MAHSTLHRHRRPETGFTLIELMIVVAIIGILSTVAYPAYTDYVRRGQAQEAFTELSTLRAKLEQYYLDQRNYGTSAGCASDSSASSWNGFTATEYFTYECTTSTPFQTFTLVAKGAKGGVTGTWYAIDQNGNRTTTKFKGATVSATCWLSKGSTC